MGTVDDKVRAWLRTFPGAFTGADSAEVLEKARAASGVDCSIAEFAEAVKRYGFQVDQVRQTYRLVLPTLAVNASVRRAAQ